MFKPYIEMLGTLLLCLPFIAILVLMLCFDRGWL